jgi:3-hydroxymyristoyl/3-hydroxydecanoyl-(acyl carrier protein) dehydratase
VLAVRHVAGAANQIVVALHVPMGLAHFPGHFPSVHILPGVVQIDWAIRYAREHMALAGHFIALENIKFLALALPDTKLELTLKLNESKSHLEFSFANGQRRCSSGRIVFGGKI